MNVIDLQKILKSVPLGLDVTVKGRRDPIVSVSVPDGVVPHGWQRVSGECKVQMIEGYQRVRYPVVPK